LIVCHCRGTTDREIRRAVRDGSTSLRDVSARCGAASGCGSCAAAVLEVMAAEQNMVLRAADTDRSAAPS
jgi:bacterioferritin-associated ferredoxin